MTFSIKVYKYFYIWGKKKEGEVVVEEEEQEEEEWYKTENFFIVECNPKFM